MGWPYDLEEENWKNFQGGFGQQKVGSSVDLEVYSIGLSSWIVSLTLSLVCACSHWVYVESPPWIFNLILDLMVDKGDCIGMVR